MIVRASRAAIVERGLPSCACGGILWPWDLDDLDAVALAGRLSDELYASHPLVIEYERKLASVRHGQAPQVQRGRDDCIAQPDALAFQHVAELVRSTNVAAQLAAARRLRVEEEIPF